MTDANTNKLQRSVITSSTDRRLAEFVNEVRTIVGSDVAFDFMVMRENDWMNASATVDDPQKPTPTFTKILSNHSNYLLISKWATETLGHSKANVTALATYFPDISSAYPGPRSEAIKAITNSVRLAIDFVKNGISTAAIVEVVCGTILDPCACSDCLNTGRTFVTDRSEKIGYIVQSLAQVVRNVKLLQKEETIIECPFAIGVELEPGEIYVVDSVSSIRAFFEEVEKAERVLQKQCDEAEILEPGDLQSSIGLNLDLAHMRIARISAEDLVPFKDRIVHAHISDHPWMHTRDQVVGQWTSIDRHANGYEGYIRLLMERLKSPSRLPFSGAIALELEGCNRIRWVVNGLTAMKQLIESAWHH